MGYNNVMSIQPKELEEIISNWNYWCPNISCKNRTFRIDTNTDKFLVSENSKRVKKFLTIRVLICERCSVPTIIGTNTYYSNEKGWGASGSVILESTQKMLAAASIVSSLSIPKIPTEYIAFTEPVTERPLPGKLPVKIVKSFREAEYAVNKNKPISAAATIRNTLRLLVEHYKITEEHFKDQLKELPFDKEFIVALQDMKIMGDDSLHYEEYKISDIIPALEVLHLALEDYYSHIHSMSKLHSAVSIKASKKAKS